MKKTLVSNESGISQDSTYLKYLAEKAGCTQEDYFNGHEKVILNRFFRKMAQIIINTQVSSIMKTKPETEASITITNKSSK